MGVGAWGRDAGLLSCARPHPPSVDTAIMNDQQRKARGPQPPTKRNAADPIAAALERVVSATDPRLRQLSGYARQLRGPVEQALAQLDILVAALAPPMELSLAAREREHLLRALFPSPKALAELVSASRARQDLLRRLEPDEVDEAFGTLLLRCDAGSEPAAVQEAHNFAGREPRLTLVASSAPELAETLRSKALEYLCLCALLRIVENASDAAAENESRGLLRAKLKAVERQGHGFVALYAHREPSGEAVEAAHRRLGQIERELGTVHAGAPALRRALAVIREVLEASGSLLRHERVELTVRESDSRTRSRIETIRYSCDQLVLEGERRLDVLLARVPVAAVAGD